YRLPLTAYRLPLSDYRLLITGYLLPLTGYRLLITLHYLRQNAGFMQYPLPPYRQLRNSWSCMSLFSCYALCLFFCLMGCQSPREDVLRSLIAESRDSLFRAVIDNVEKYRLQIIYTQIDRDENNRPAFHDYYFNVDSLTYFNPASTVKLPLALLSLEKLNMLGIEGVDKYTPVLFDSAFSGQTRKHTDSTSENGLPSIAHFIRKAFLVSDN